MKRLISDRHIVVVLFVLVFVTFSLAHEDSKDFEQFQSGIKTIPAAEKTAEVSSPTSENQSDDASKNSFIQATSVR